MTPHDEGTDGTTRVLVVDDQALVRSGFSMILSSEDGFEVFPYTTEDLVVADRLVEAGCRVLMPWGAPIG